MTSSLTWAITEQSGSLRVKLSGEITEKSRLDELVPRLSGTVIVDTSEVRRINSTGVRAWIEFARAARAKGVALIVERCSVAFVHQLNLNAVFRTLSAVHSVHAPYYCPRCNAEHSLLVDLSSPRPRVEESPPCPTCGGVMEFDDLPDRYLSFHAHAT